MKLFHGTDEDAAAAILRDGFRDSYLSEGVHGVFLSDEHGAYGVVHLAVEAPDDVAARCFCEYENDAQAPREWCVPAAVLNALPRWRVEAGA